MAGNNDSWKALIYPLIILFTIYFIVNIVVTPFTNNNITVQTYNDPLGMITYLNNLVQTGTVFNINTCIVVCFNPGASLSGIYQAIVPSVLRNAMAQEIAIWSYIPVELSTPLLLICIASLTYFSYTLIVMLIP